MNLRHLMDFGKKPFTIKVLNTNQIVHSMDCLLYTSKKLEQGLQNLEVEIKREARRLQRFCGEIQELDPEELLIPVQEAANTAQKAYAVFTGDELSLIHI